MAKKGQAAEILAVNLGNLMRAKGIRSEPHLEKLSKVSQKTINNIVHRRHDPRLSTLESLARALGVELHQMLCPISDEKFLALCQAWAQSDERGKEDLRTIAEAILKKRAGDTPKPAADSPSAVPARGGARS